MSRYRDSAYAPPPPTRWDADRFARERDYREVDEYYQPAPPPQRRPTRPVYEEEERAYYEDDRYGPRGSRVERQYFEEDGYYDPRTARGQMVPFRPARPPRQEAPPRPGLLRRQSSLDTFDRPAARRYDDYEDYRPPPRPSRVNIDVPPPPGGPGSNRYRPRRPPGPAYYDEYDDRGYYDDVAVQDPDLYGDDGFREYREREWVRHRARDDSRDRSASRSRPPPEPPAESVREEKRETVRKEEIKEEVKEKPYPRRGKTKMPKRLVHTKVLFDLGYPFYEEGEKTIIIEKALGPENIDEVFAKSREYREKEVSTTLRIEAPPPSAPPPQSVRSPTVKSPTRAQSVAIPSIHEAFKEEIIFKETEVKTKPISEAPRSVREWDQLQVQEDSRSVRSSSRRRSTAVKPKSRRGSPSPNETIVERKSIVVEREPPQEEQRRRRRHRSRSRRRSRSSSVDETEIIERRIRTEEDNFFDESNSVHVGPLALVIDRQKEEYGNNDLKREIRRLENERRALRRERKERDNEEIYIERRVERSPSPVRRRRADRDSTDIIIEREQVIARGLSPLPPAPPPIRKYERYDDDDLFVERRRVDFIEEVRPPDVSETIIERRGDDIVETRRDRRERSFSRTRAPSAGLIKSMMYTLT